MTEREDIVESRPRVAVRAQEAAVELAPLPRGVKDAALLAMADALLAGHAAGPGGQRGGRRPRRGPTAPTRPSSTG